MKNSAGDDDFLYKTEKSAPGRGALCKRSGLILADLCFLQINYS